MATAQQVKENLEILNQRNQSLIDLANATTGKEDTTLTDGVNSLIEKYDLEPTLQEKVVTENGEVVPDEGFDGLSKVTVNVPEKEVKLQDKTITENGTYQADSDYDGLGSVTVEVASSGSLEGLENGYDVMFYDENNDGLAFYSIKQGHSINAPVYNCKAWQTDAGANVEFPYTPTEDVIFYANNDTYASSLYKYYGVDSAVYPYLFINFEAKTTVPVQCTYKVVFGKTMPDSYYLNDVLNASYSYTDGSINEVPDLDTLVLKIMEHISPSALAASSTDRTATSKSNIYATNYDVKESYISQFYAYYRLDE